MASNDTHIELTFMIEIKKKQVTGTSSEGTAVALVFLFIAAFSLNSILVGTVASSYLLKKIPFHLIILSLGCVHLVETVFNVAISIVFVTAQKWSLGEIFCFINAAVWSFVPSILSIHLTFALLERVVAVRHTTRYKQRVTPVRQSVAIIVVWIIATIISLPIALGEIYSRPFLARYACCPSDIVQETYNVLYPILVYAIPSFISIICVIYLGVVLTKDYLVSKGTHRHLTMNDKVLRQPLLWTELQLSKVAVAVYIIFLAFHIPCIVNMHVDQTISNHSFPVITRTNNGTNFTEVRPEVLLSPKQDTPFTWFRYLEAVIFPIIVLVLRRDIRGKALVLIVFWKAHPTADMSPRHSAYVQKNGRSLKGTGNINSSVKRKKRKSKKELAHYNTPVLFATSEGLYLRVTEETARRAQSGGFRFWLETGAPLSAEEPEFVCHVCDVWDAYDDIEDLEETFEPLEEGMTMKDEEDHLQKTLNQAQVFNFRRASSASSRRRFSLPSTSALRQGSAPSLHLGEPEKINIRGGNEEESGYRSSGEDSGVAEDDSEHVSMASESSHREPLSSERRKSVRFAEEINEIPRSAVAPLESPKTIRRLSLPPITIRELPLSGRYQKRTRVRPAGNTNGVEARVRRKLNRPAWNSNTRVENTWTRPQKRSHHERTGSGSKVYPSSYSIIS